MKNLKIGNGAQLAEAKTRLALMTTIVTDAVKSVNHHAGENGDGDPNADKIARAIGYQAKINDLYNYFTATSAENAQAKLLLDVVATLADRFCIDSFGKKIDTFVPPYEYDAEDDAHGVLMTQLGRALDALGYAQGACAENAVTVWKEADAQGRYDFIVRLFADNETPDATQKLLDALKPALAVIGLAGEVKDAAVDEYNPFFDHYALFLKKVA